MAGAAVPINDLPDNAVPQGDLPDFQAMRQTGAASARQDPQFQAFARATIPTLAGLIPGSIPAQMLIQGGATAANQALGLEPVDPGQIGTSMLIPPVVHGGLGLVKAATKGLSELLNPSAVRSAGVDAVANTVGAPKTAMERIFTSPASRAALEDVMKAGPVATDELNSTLTAAVNKLSNRANPPTAAVRYLDKMAKKFQPGQQADYADVVDEIQTLKATADKWFSRGDAVTGRALMEARGQLLDTLDKASPAVKKFNSLYRQEQAQAAIVAEARKGNPGPRLEQFFTDNPSVAKDLGQQRTKQVLDIANSLNDVGSSSPVGLANKAFTSVAEPFSQLLATDEGRGIIRGLMGPNGKLTIPALLAIGQFGRAYLAQQRRIQQGQ